MALSNLVQLSANLGRNLMEGRLEIVAAVFEAASTKTRIYTEDRS
jgi:sarcosine/dimethylglycine N-methyltransferase